MATVPADLQVGIEVPDALADACVITKAITRVLPFSPEAAARLATWYVDADAAGAAAYAAALRAGS